MDLDLLQRPMEGYLFGHLYCIESTSLAARYLRAGIPRSARRASRGRPRLSRDRDGPSPTNAAKIRFPGCGHANRRLEGRVRLVAAAQIALLPVVGIAARALQVGELAERGRW